MPEQQPERQPEPNRNPDAQASAILSRLTLREKLRLMAGTSSLVSLGVDFLVLGRYNRRPYPAGGLRKHGVPPVLFSDGPRGVVSGRATCFPVAMARGASWDPELEERIGDAIGREVRANGGNFFGGVCVNLLRHPAWGRAQETYGEDPHLLGEMGAALVRGVQRHNVMACVKHYALNSIENARFTVDVTVDERALREVYLPHFRRCVDEGAASIMGAYNKVRGEHACENAYLLRDILKGEWSFEGFVMSDFVFGVREGARAAAAGTDVEMPFRWRFGRKLLRAVRGGTVPEAVIDEAALRVLRTVLRFTQADDPEAYPSRVVACATHTALAREAAERSMTLIRNERRALPLDAGGIGRVAVFGPLADAETIGDHGSSRVYPPYVVTPLQGLEEYAGDTVDIVHLRDSDPSAAAREAAAADAAIVFAGYDHRDEGEHLTRFHRAGDRTSLHLCARDVELIRAVSASNPRTVVVLIGGSAVIVEEWKDHVAAILLAWYPGMEGGRAIARTLFGAVNPGGKLPFTIPVADADLPFFDRNARAIEYGYFHGYTLLDRVGGRAAYPFGFGLSYTSFTVKDVCASAQADHLTVSAVVRNVGEVTGEEVVQVYAGFPASDRTMPVKKLVGFRRVSVDAGESATLVVPVSVDALRWYNPDSRRWMLDRGEYTLHVGTSSDARDLTTIHVTL